MRILDWLIILFLLMGIAVGYDYYLWKDLPGGCTYCQTTLGIKIYGD